MWSFKKKQILLCKNVNENIDNDFRIMKKMNDLNAFFQKEIRIITFRMV